jgi:CheY-like chemotaxis protein
MKPYILIVDDEYGLADVIASLLTDRGYDAAIAINGKIALDLLAQRVADLVFTDMMMPIMDGPELVHAMRDDPRFKDIPIVLMTALPEALPPGTESQFDAVLVKPFTFDEMFAVMSKLMRP